MRIRLYSIRDCLLGVYLAPFAARGDVEAVRQIKASLADPQMSKSAIVTNPSDFELCYMATLDDETGQVFPEDRSLPLPFVVTRLAPLVSSTDRPAVAPGAAADAAGGGGQPPVDPFLTEDSRS